MQKTQIKRATTKPLDSTELAASRVSSEYGTKYGYFLFENAYGYAGVHKIDIANAGLVCVVGHNLQSQEPSSSGAGKTRMWKLMLYLWYGRKALGSAESIKDAMVFGKNFRIENTVKRHNKWYLVREAHNHESYPEGLHAYEIVGKKLKPWGAVNDPNMLRAKLQALIGMTYNEMIGTTIWPQDFTHTLICGKPQERITFLSDLYGFTKYDDIYRYLDGLHIEVKSEIEKLLEFKGEYRAVEQEVSHAGNINDIIAKARSLRALIDQNAPRLTAMRAQLTDTSRRVDRYNEISRQLDDFQKLELDTQERTLLVDGKLLSTFDESCRAIERKLEKAQQLQDKYAQLVEIEEKLATLNLPTVDLQLLEKELSNLNTRVIPELSRKTRWNRSQIDLLTRGAAALKTQIADACRQLRIKPDQRLISESYEKIKQYLSEITADMRATSEQHSTLSSLVANISDHSKSACKCPMCLQDIDVKAVQRVIDQLLDRGQALDSKCIEIEDKHDAIESLHSKFVDYSKLANEARDAAASLQDLDALDQAHARVLNIDQTLRVARQHRKLLDQRSQLKTDLQGVNVSKLTKAVQHYTRIVEDNETRRDTYYQAEHVSAQVIASAEALSISDPFELDVVSELQQLNSQRERLEMRLEQANAKINDARVQYDRYKQIADNYRQKRDHLAALQEKIKRLNELENRELVIAKTKPAYSKTGFKREGLRKLLQALAGRLPYWTRILFTEKDFAVEVNGDERKLSLTVAKRILVDGKMKTQKIDVSALSGGERSRLAVCLMLTMSELVAREKRSNLLVLDEADRSLDPYGQRLLAGIFIPLMRKRKDGLFVISHSQEIDPKTFDRTLTVTKEKNGVTHVVVKDNTHR
jgi:DNA repair exonuclease SbcCD ATPase subunit